jgi:hypothetical protein
MPSPVGDHAELLDVDELTPGKAKKDITTLQAKKILASVRPRDLAGKTRRRLAAEQLADLVVVDKKTKALTKELKAMVLASGSRLMDLPGIGPVLATRTLADVGNVARFADRNRFASWTRMEPGGQAHDKSGVELLTDAVPHAHYLPGETSTGLQSASLLSTAPLE